MVGEYVVRIFFPNYYLFHFASKYSSAKRAKGRVDIGETVYDEEGVAHGNSLHNEGIKLFYDKVVLPSICEAFPSLQHKFPLSFEVLASSRTGKGHISPFSKTVKVGFVQEILKKVKERIEFDSDLVGFTDFFFQSSFINSKLIEPVEIDMTTPMAHVGPLNTVFGSLTSSVDLSSCEEMDIEIDVGLDILPVFKSNSYCLLPKLCCLEEYLAQLQGRKIVRRHNFAHCWDYVSVDCEFSKGSEITYFQGYLSWKDSFSAAGGNPMSYLSSRDRDKEISGSVGRNSENTRII